MKVVMDSLFSRRRWTRRLKIDEVSRRWNEDSGRCKGQNGSAAARFWREESISCIPNQAMASGTVRCCCMLVGLGLKVEGILFLIHGWSFSSYEGIPIHVQNKGHHIADSPQDPFDIVLSKSFLLSSTSSITQTHTDASHSSHTSFQIRWTSPKFRLNSLVTLGP